MKGSGGRVLGEGGEEEQERSKEAALSSSVSDGSLRWLLLARLALSLLSLGIAFGLERLGRDVTAEARFGLFATVGVAFASTALCGAWLRRVRREAVFGCTQIAVDVGVVTALIYFSGGRESVFTFLYVIVALYGAALFGRVGALVAATMGSVAYGVVILGVNLGQLPAYGAKANRVAPGVLAVIWGVHAGALYLVGALASLLASQLQRAGKALDQSTADLQRLHDLHERTVESIMSGLLTTNRDGAVTSFNPEAERITGLRAEQAMGRTLEDLIPGASALVLGLRQKVRPLTARTRLEFRNRGGEDLHLGLAGSILRDEQGEELGHVVIFQDVTDVVAMERGLRQSERLAAVGEMAAKIAHEIRNPLASISGSVQILAGEIDAIGSQREGSQLMGIVLRETDRLNSLIGDFLAYSRPSRPRRRSVLVAPLICEAATMLETQERTGVRIEWACEEHLAVFADRDQIEEVIWNLSINALEAMPEGGTLRMAANWLPEREGTQEESPEGRNEEQRGGGSAACEGPWIEISVEDTGSGIETDVLEHVFEPFFTTKRKGTGLGLATVHRIVESHAGLLLVESTVGEGTTFRLRLPGWEAGSW